jgi:hypothetical protein
VPDSVFGPLFSGQEVEAAAKATLDTWAPTYLAWAARAAGRPKPPPTPRWYTTRDVESGDWPQAQPPAVLIVSPGLADAPRKHGRNRSYSATFALGFVVIASARDRDTTDTLAMLYTAALRVCLIHRASLGGIASGIEWIDERYDVLPDRNRRQLAAGRAEFRVDVDDVVGGSGPSAPDPPDDPTTPIPDPPRVESAEVEVRAEPIA